MYTPSNKRIYKQNNSVQVSMTMFVNPGMIMDNLIANEGLLLHEGLRLLGFDDQDLQKGLGQTTQSADNYQAAKRLRDWKGQPVRP